MSETTTDRATAAHTIQLRFRIWLLLMLAMLGVFALHVVPTLKIETDAGSQTRLLHFLAPGSNVNTAAAAASRTLQGYSIAEWQRGGGQQDAFLGRGVGAGGAQRWGGLQVVTTNMLAGWLRPNGVPYSGYWSLCAAVNRAEQVAS